MTEQHCGIIVTNIGKLVTFEGADRPLSGSNMLDLDIIENAAVAIRNNKIIAIGTIREIIGQFDAQNYLDAMQMLVTPGLIDAHTHPVFAKTRS